LHSPIVIFDSAGSSEGLNKSGGELAGAQKTPGGNTPHPVGRPASVPNFVAPKKLRQQITPNIGNVNGLALPQIVYFHWLDRLRLTA